MRAVYHWWALGNPCAYNNLVAPIIVSLATLRGHNPTLPITVLDCSPEPVEWGDFPEVLKFEVVRIKPFLEDHQDKVQGWRHLSRIFDLNRLNDPEILYVDSDIFFLQNPIPLACNPSKFCWNGWNTGLFYYNNQFKAFTELFEQYTWDAILHPDKRAEYRSFVGYDDWYGVWDEMMLTFMLNKHPELFELIPKEENSTAGDFRFINPRKIRMFHANGSLIANPVAKFEWEGKYSRGLLGIVVKELYEKMCQVLPQEYIQKIYTQAELDTFLKHQFMLTYSAEQVLQCRREDKYFHLDLLFKKPVRKLFI